MSSLKAIGSIASIIDKLVPNRKQRKYNEYQKLLKQLEKAMLDDNTTLISITRVRLRELREQNKYLDES